jgi:hypothetical protein
MNAHNLTVMRKFRGDVLKARKRLGMSSSRVETEARIGKGTLGNWFTRGDVPGLALVEKVCIVLELKALDYPFEPERGGRRPRRKDSTANGLPPIPDHSTPSETLIARIERLESNVIRCMRELGISALWAIKEEGTE